MSSLTPFTFIPGSGVSLSVTSSSARVALSTADSNQLLIANPGNATFYFKTGDSTVTATTADCPALAGAQFLVSRNPSHTHVAAICGGSDTSTLLAGNANGE